MWLSQENLRWTINKRAIRLGTCLVWQEYFRKTEVYQFWNITFFFVKSYHYVFQFYVSMSDSDLMKILHPVEDLSHQCSRPVLPHKVLFRILHKITPIDIFQYHVYALLVFEYVDKSDDVVMVKHFEYFDLIQAQFHISTLHFPLLNLFHRHYSVRSATIALEHFAKSSLAQESLFLIELIYIPLMSRFS